MVNCLSINPSYDGNELIIILIDRIMYTKSNEIELCRSIYIFVSN